MRALGVLVVALLSGCAATTQEQEAAAAIQTGMTSADVTALLGLPDSVDVTSNNTKLVRYFISVADAGKRLTCMGAGFSGELHLYPECNEASGYHLTIKFENDSVVGYDRTPRAANTRDMDMGERTDIDASYSVTDKSPEAPARTRRQNEEAREATRQCQDALRRAKLGTTSGHQVNDACFGREGF